VLKIPPEARYLGAVAAYRDLNNSKWKALVAGARDRAARLRPQAQADRDCRAIRSEDRACQLKKVLCRPTIASVWSEGLFLRPQHFQQQERHLERYIEGRSRELRAHSWGFTELELERDLLAIGKFGLRRAAGVFPDGTPFSMPDDDPCQPLWK